MLPGLANCLGPIVLENKTACIFVCFTTRASVDGVGLCVIHGTSYLMAIYFLIVVIKNCIRLYGATILDLSTAENNLIIQVMKRISPSCLTIDEFSRDPCLNGLLSDLGFT